MEFVELSKIEQDTASEVINIGLAKAADSLSFFTKEEVIIKSSDFKLRKLDDSIKFSVESKKDVHVLTTLIKGKMEGACFLIFEDDDAEKLYTTTLSPEILSDPEKKEAMAPAIMLEVDNIVTAAVVTQFSNLLNYEIHGDVPHIERIPSANLDANIREKLIGNEFFLSFQTAFISKNLKIAPQFVWTLDKKFTEGIKKLVNK